MILNRKLWCVFFIVVLMNGCEKNSDLTTKKQTDAFVSVKNEVNESLEDKEIISNETTERIKVGITLKRDPSVYDSIVHVDQNITELYFLKSAIIGIEGLSQLKSLNTIVFDKVSDLHDFSFLADAPQLKRFFVVSVTKNIDWSFIEQLPDLEVLYVESYRLFVDGNYYQPAISIDLKNNKHLEYIGFESGLLETFPTLTNVPDSLKYLNLDSNLRIRSLPEDFDKYSNTTIILSMNQFWKGATTPSNITFEYVPNILEQKYRLPLNMPFISGSGD